MLSVIIPALNEVYLQKTISNVLENARGELEIIAILDGYWPDPPIEDHPQVRLIHNTVPRGQRHSINDACKIALGKYMMKLDAHCAVSEGFDVILAEDCKYEWTMVPRMYNLDIETFLPKKHKRTDYMFIGLDGEKNIRSLYYDKRSGARQPRSDKEIDETMTCMGPGWFMHLERFWELGGCDESHGHWGQQGVEVACKAWLSGGALMVSKKCWFAHWFRGHITHDKGPGAGRKGFPYPITKRQTNKARNYSNDLWLNNKWPQQVRTFEWLREKFNPPLWDDDTGAKKMKARRQRSHVTDKIFQTKDLFANYPEIVIPRKRERLLRFRDTFPEFLEKVGERLDTLDYYKYLTDRGRNPHDRALRIMNNEKKQFIDIRDNGLKRPLDFVVVEGHYILQRGYRRLFMLDKLGYEEIPARVFKSMDHFTHLAPATEPSGRLDEIASRHFQQKLHKSTDKYWLHDYLPRYEKHICNPTPPKSILEIGVYHGASLDLWKEAFPDATVYGIDKKNHGVDHEVFIGGQDDPKLAKRIKAELGSFDMIVDDASHQPDHTTRTFELYFPMCKKWYVIEDIFMNYRGGKRTGSLMGRIHELIDEMNLTCAVKAIHLYYNIVFIEKYA